jgi:hypothetical protein
MPLEQEMNLVLGLGHLHRVDELVLRHLVAALALPDRAVA